MTRQFCQQWPGQAFITSSLQSCHFTEFCRVFSSCDEFLVVILSSPVERESVEVFTRPFRSSLTFVLR